MTEHEQLAALQRTRLQWFLMKVFETLHPGAEPLRLAWYLQAICNALEGAAAGERQRLVISVPPRHLKSITASVAFVAWLLGRDPTLKIMVATYSAELAREHAEACRLIMESDWYKTLFARARLSPRSNRQLGFKTTAGGGRRAVSVSGSITGLGADIIILDDCMKADDIASEAARAAVKQWYANTLLTRLNDKLTGTIISIQQRLGEDDLTAWLLDRGSTNYAYPRSPSVPRRCRSARGGYIVGRSANCSIRAAKMQRRWRACVSSSAARCSPRNISRTR